ncbi:MAG: DUF7312 domain-containing protein [Halobacteriota archaeon]
MNGSSASDGDDDDDAIEYDADGDDDAASQFDTEADATVETEPSDDRTPGDASPRETDERGWRFELDEVGPDADRNADAGANRSTQRSTDPKPIKPESISVENAFFVTIGVALTIVVILAAV